MSTVKAITDFSRYLAADLAPAAGRIHAKMSENAAIFPAPPMAMAAFGALVEDYKAKYAARQGRATADVLAFKIARKALAAALCRLGAYVNTVAEGDPAVVERSGFPSYSTARTPDLSAPTAPLNLRLKHAGPIGSIVARYKAARRPSMNEVQVCMGDPNDESQWRTVGIFQGQKVTLTGLTPGAIVWVRVRTAGLRGKMGNWSDPAEIRVL